ncbi:BrxA/BrxB family bacilliredoxin [Numidum massiliense]|uniref:BrxA/BrxB family bacilliredoxin n=1 Tax=Numidum massiliense TaxID=1522315 RepID=UPI0006D5962E|nr:BrxA/BrxB family bacilliredoxin [Numidum massiliense]
MSMFYRQYMDDIVKPMREELTSIGFKELLTPEDVVETLENNKGTTVVFVNSVCGCAGGLARPAMAYSLKHDVTPDHLVTVFAGQDKEATAKAREYFTGYPPSSPSIALLKDGHIQWMLPREQIEGRDGHAIVADLTAAYDKYCG